jgi:membrane-associated phospholipid phosphatase
MDGTPGIGTIGTAADLGRADRLIWGLIAAVAALVLTSAAAFGFSLVWHSFLAPGITVVVLFAAQWLYQTRRPDLRLAGALGATAQMTAFAAVGAPLSYLGAATDLPLYDLWFDNADRALGFDWSGMLRWMDAQAALHPLFEAAYTSLMPQTLVVVLALGWAGRLTGLRQYVLTFIIATLATILLAALLPAEGVWGYYNLHPSDYPHIAPAAHGVHLPIFHGLRDGSYRLLVATGAEGIITFPSLHSALAVLLAAALWPVPVLRWIAVALNAVMLVSIPVDGGHYFIDIFAGVAIACLSLYAARRLIAGPTPHLADANTANPANSIAQIAVRSR